MSRRDDQPPRLDKALNLENQGLFKEAIEVFRRILKQQPSHFQALVHMARCHEQLGQWTYAFEAWGQPRSRAQKPGVCDWSRRSPSASFLPFECLRCL